MSAAGTPGAGSKIPVGFVGLGQLGRPMAARLLELGWPLTVWARRPEKLERLVAAGAEVAADLRALGARSSIVGICVNNDDDVASVLHGGLLDGLSAGAIVLVHSTIRPATARRLADECSEVGVHLLDATVAGGPTDAATGLLIVAAAGDAATVERATPVMQTYGSTVLHVGEVGSGQALKLLNNLYYYAMVELLHATVAIGSQFGLDLDDQTTFMTHAASTGFDKLVAREALRPSIARHIRSLLAKDVTYATEMLSDLGIDGGPVGAAAHGLLETLDTLSGDRLAGDGVAR